MKPRELLKPSPLSDSTQKTLDMYIKRHTARMPHLDVIKESHEGDYGLLWGVFAAPNAIFKRGIGKSVLSIKILLAVYRSWDTAKQYIFYSPQEFIRVFEKLVDRKERIPAAVWDDAGAWLFRGRFKSRFVMAVAEHLEVIRTHISTLFFTATSYGKLAKAIRESITLVDLVSLRERRNGVKLSVTRGYHAEEDMSWLFHRSRAPTPLWEYMFRVYLPDAIYRDYLEMRNKYVETGLKKVKAELKELADKAAAELAEVAAKSEGAEPVELDVDAEDLDIEDLREAWGY